MSRRHITTKATFLVVLASGWPALGEAPRYRLTIVQDAAAYDTISRTVNRAGASAGYLLDFDGSQVSMHAFVAARNGSVTRIAIPNNPRSIATAMNDHGAVSGTFTIVENNLWFDRLFRYTPALGFVDLGTPGGRNGWVYDMNNRGEIVGYWSDSTGQSRAFKYSDATGWTVLTPDSVDASWAEDINERGEVIGNVWTSGTAQQSWHWRDGVLTPLGTLGGVFTHAYYINNSGVVVGHAEAADGSTRAFQWTKEAGMTGIPLMEGALDSKAFWVTDSGLIGGTQRFEVELEGGNIETQYRAFLYSNARGLVDLNVDMGTDWQSPTGMNEAGEAIFRTMDLHVYELHPYVYSPESGLHDLNSVIEGEWPFEVNDPSGINACGEISAVAWGAFGTPNQPQSLSVLLSPIRTGDLDGDSDVDLADYARLQANFGTATGASSEQGDLDSDGDVDAGDAQSLIAAWRAPCR